MARLSAENIIADFGFYLAIAVPFGLAVGGADLQNLLNTIFGPWPTFAQTVTAISGPAKACGATDFGCQASAGISQATAFVGAVLSYGPILGASALTRISAFGQLGTFIAFGPTASLATIPGAPLIITVFIILIVFELFRMFRGSSVGA